MSLYCDNIRGELFAHEDNDCVVIALTIAAQIDYATAHQLCRKHGRITGKGTYDHTVRKVAIELGAVQIDLVNGRNIIGLKDSDRPNLQQFIIKHPIGRYLLVRRGHAFAIVDSEVRDHIRGTETGSVLYTCYHFSSALEMNTEVA